MEEEKIDEVRQLFRLLPEKFQRKQTIEGGVYHLVIDSTSWTVTLNAENCLVEEDVLSGKADCYLKTSAEIFLGTIKGLYTPSFSDIINGRIKVIRPELLLAFKEAFDDEL